MRGRIFRVAGAALLLIVAAALWVAGREASLQWAVQKAVAASGGAATVSGVSGSLYGPLHLDQLTVRSPERNIVAEKLDLAWSPWQLLTGRIAIDRLQVATLTIETLAESAQAVTLPETLALPLGLQASQVEIKQLVIASLSSRTTLEEIHLTLAADGRQWRLQDASAATPWGKFSASAQLAATRPFAIDGKANLTQNGAQLNAQFGGNLSTLSVNASADAHGASGEAALTLTPFERLPMRDLVVKAQGIDPARFADGLPQADLRLDLSAQVSSNQSVSGQLALVNHAPPGSLDRQRLPLHTIAAQLAGSVADLRIDRVLLDFGAAGKFSGDGSLRDGKATFALHTDRLDLQAIHGRMNRSKIAGDIVLSNQDGTQTLTAALAQQRLRLDLHATLAAGLLQLRQAQLRAAGSEVNISGEASLNGRQAFNANGSVKRFNPADFGTYPAADINTDFRVSGNLVPEWNVAADFAFRPSRLFNRPLSGKGQLSADAKQLRDIDVSVGLGGNTLDAKGNFGAPGDRLTWRIAAKRLAVLHDQLAGALDASGNLSGTIAVPLLAFDARAQGLRWNADAPRAGADSLVQASGEMALRGAGVFKVNGNAKHVNPIAFGDYPKGSISGDFNASGRIGSDWRVALDLALQPSTLLDQALSGHATLAADPTHLSDADVNLHLAENSVSLRGNFGGARDQLSWKVDAPALRVLGPQFAGAVKGDGTLGGTRALPRLAFKLEAQQLRLFGQHQIKSLRAAGRIDDGDSSPLQAEIDVSDYHSDGFALQSLRLQASGTRQAHTVRVSARNDVLDLQGEADGGWSQQHGWEGSIRSLQNRGRLAFALQAPAPLQLSAEQMALKDAVLKLGEGRITLQSLQKNGAHLQTKGQANGVPLRFLAQFSKPLRENLDTNLTFGADWSLAVDQTIDGALHVFRENGDATIRADVPLALGISGFDLRADIVKNALRAKFDTAGERLGRIRFDAAAQLAQRDGQWHLAGASPLILNGSANMPSLAWLAPLTGQPALELDGKIALTLSGAGTVAAPQLSGALSADKLAVRWADEGLKLRNGELRAQLSGDQLLLQRLHFDGEQGTANLEGTIRFADAIPTMQLKFVADKLQVLSRPDRLLVISGQSALSLDKKRLQLNGKMKADRALIELPEQTGPTFSSDVVVKGAPPKQANTLDAMPITIDLEADLGEQFFVKGKGLDAQLAGLLRIRSGDNQAPRATGSIRVVRGTYAAYGQRLQIERGIINFTGPLDNPGLNILAVRKISDPDNGVEAGVEVRGTALAPTAKLVSTPTVPDSEKLSWLVLGHGTEGGGSNEFGLLSAAANALFGASQAASLQARVANSLGLDEVGVTRAKGIESTVLTLGKRISSRAYLSYEQGVSGATSLVKLRYSLTKRLSLQAQTGTNSALDLLYTWSFD